MFILFSFARSLSGSRHRRLRAAPWTEEQPGCARPCAETDRAGTSDDSGSPYDHPSAATTHSPASLMGERTEIEAIQTGCAQPPEHPPAGGRRASGERREPRRLPGQGPQGHRWDHRRASDRKSTRLNSSHSQISYAVFCLKKKKHTKQLSGPTRTNQSAHTHYKPGDHP